MITTVSIANKSMTSDSVEGSAKRVEAAMITAVDKGVAVGVGVAVEVAVAVEVWVAVAVVVGVCVAVAEGIEVSVNLGGSISGISRSVFKPKKLGMQFGRI